MRRTLSISLVLLLWLGPLAAVLPGISESRLPFCCRRHGAHHCAMDADQAAAQNDGSGPVISAPSRCPQFPAAIATTPAPAFAPAGSPATTPALRVGIYAPGSSRDAARMGQLRSQADRGPPALATA
jgi:hypothetical protein